MNLVNINKFKLEKNGPLKDTLAAHAAIDFMNNILNDMQSEIADSGGVITRRYKELHEKLIQILPYIEPIEAKGDDKRRLVEP